MASQTQPPKLYFVLALAHYLSVGLGKRLLPFLPNLSSIQVLLIMTVPSDMPLLVAHKTSPVLFIGALD